MREYIESLEHDFSLIENGFKVEEKRALDDYKAHDREYIKELAFLAYKSEVYQVRRIEGDYARRKYCFNSTLTKR